MNTTTENNTVTITPLQITEAQVHASCIEWMNELQPLDKKCSHLSYFKCLNKFMRESGIISTILTAIQDEAGDMPISEAITEISDSTTSTAKVASLSLYTHMGGIWAHFPKSPSAMGNLRQKTTETVAKPELDEMF